MNKRITAFLLMLTLLLSTGVLSACRTVQNTVESERLKQEMDIEDNDFENPAYSNEEDGAEVVTKAHDKEDFIGTWEATSKRAAYLYGNINLKINEDGTWKGNITEENFHGNWRYDGSGIIIKDSEAIINWRLFYATDGTLMVENNEEPGDPLVLEKGSFGN